MPPETFKFENGKPIQRGGAYYGNSKDDGTRLMEAQVICGDYNGKAQVAFAKPGVTCTSEDSFWKQLDGGLCNLSKGHYRTFNRYTILGFAEYNVTRDGKTNNASGDDFDEALRTKKYVGALAIKTFPSKEKLDEELAGIREK